MLKPLALLLALASFSSGPAWGQAAFRESSLREYIPFRTDFAYASAAADVDGDGDLDVYVGVQRDTQDDAILLNDGNGIFTEAAPGTLPTNGGGTTPARFGDVDGDGDEDLVTGNYPPGLYLNDGAGVFADVTATHMPAILLSSSALELGDVDGDGDLDLFLTTFGTTLPRHRLYQNDGTGVFTDVSDTHLPLGNEDTRDVALVDVDADGDLDAVLAYWNKRNRLYRNDGSGVFSDATAQLMPPDTDPTYCITPGDVDGDSDTDLFIGDYYGNDQVLLNDGAGAFTVAPVALPPGALQTFEAALGDLDGDGDLDLVLAKLFGQDRLLLNDGSGTFADATAQGMPVETSDTYVLTLEDLDGDGDLDLLNGRGRQDRLYLNDGQASFADATPVVFPWEKMNEPTSVAVLDLERDGDLDVVVGDGGPTFGFHSNVYRNDGRDGFVHSILGVGTSRNTRAVVAGDVNGDGFDDVILGESQTNPHSDGARAPMPAENRLFLNDGAGGLNWDPTRLPPDKDETTSLALGDIDADGDLDLVVGNTIGQQNRLYRNNGNGVFTDVTATRFPSARDWTSAVLFVDVDGDVDLDLLIGNQNEPSLLYRNNGHGVFTDITAGRLPAVTHLTRTVAAGDLDGDGDQDLLLGTSEALVLYLNDGSGTFVDATAQVQPFGLPLTFTQALALTDFEGDGDLDILVGRRRVAQEARNVLLVNNGLAEFKDASNLLPPRDGATTALALADLDGDGDDDLVEVSDFVAFEFYWPSQLHVGLRHHLRLPRLPILGEDYPLEYHALEGYGVAPRVAIGAYSSALLPAPVAVGTFRGELHLLPPLTFFPPVTIPSGSASVRQELPLPADPSLAGTTIYIQAAILGLPQGSAFTGAFEETLRL